MISVIMPCYNRAAFIKRALDNIAAQTLKPFEVIIVDDGSTDNSSQTIDSLKYTYDFKITYLYQENQGAASARQNGVDHAKGNLFAFFDSDDLWQAEYLNSLNTALQSTELDWVYCPVERRNLETNELVSENSFYPNNEPRGFVRMSTPVSENVHSFELKDAIKEHLHNGIYMGFQNTLFKKNIFEKVSIPNLRIGEDRLMALVLLKNEFKGGFINEVLATVYEHDGNTTSSGSNNRQKAVFTYTNLIKGYEKYNYYVPLTRHEKKLVSQKIANFYFWHLGYSEPSKKIALKYMWEGIKRDPLSLKKLKSFVIKAIKV
jgi:glycosyltransferase involved in cell wall biosynthesis